MKLLKGVNNIVSLAIRLSQLVFGIIVFALGVFVADKFDSGRAGFNAAVGILTILYVVFLLVFYKFAFTILVLAIDLLFFLLWLIAFALSADDIGSASCDFFFASSSYKSACQSYKAIIAFGVLSWLLFIASLVLIILFQVVPLARNKAPTKSWTALSTLCMGGIYPQNTLVRHADAENNTGVTNENDPVAGEHKYTTDNLTTGEHKYDGHGLSLGETHYDSNVHNGGEAMYDSNAHHISEPRFDSNAQTMAAPGEQPIGYGAK